MDKTTIYNYPPHCKFSEQWGSFHKNMIPTWEVLLEDFMGRDNLHFLEIGTFHGSCAVWLLDKVLTGKNSTLHTINPLTNEYLENNLKPYSNAIFIQDTSYNALKHLLTENKEGFFDFVYIDGCHYSKYVLEDAVLSFRLLKLGGVLAFDDYGWGIHTTDEKLKPKTSIDSFLSAYQGHYNLVLKAWQVWVQKIECKYDESETKNLDNVL